MNYWHLYEIRIDIARHLNIVNTVAAEQTNMILNLPAYTMHSHLRISLITIYYHYSLQRIYARDRQWNEDQPNARFSSNAWAQRGESMSNTGWTLVADQTCRPSWDKPLEVIIL